MDVLRRDYNLPASMNLDLNTRLGSCEIAKAIGAGGPLVFAGNSERASARLAPARQWLR
jgi:hypothetical protein